jgi:hypothetical protein
LEADAKTISWRFLHKQLATLERFAADVLGTRVGWFDGKDACVLDKSPKLPVLTRTSGGHVHRIAPRSWLVLQISLSYDAI